MSASAARPRDRRTAQAATVWIVTLAAIGLTQAVPGAAPLVDLAAVAAILVIGLPHGALDLVELRADPAITAPLPAILATYLALLGATALAWWLAPGLALVGFLLLSVWHFASEWRDDLPAAAAWPAAALLIALPAAASPGAVTMLFTGLCRDPALAGRVTEVAAAAAPLLAAALLVAAIVRPVSPKEAAILAGLGVAELALPPLYAFAIFFALVHSPRHLAASARHLGRPLGVAIRDAAPLTLAALALFALLALLPRHGQPATSAFLLLAILAVPHMFSRSLLVSRPRQAAGGTRAATAGRRAA